MELSLEKWQKYETDIKRKINAVLLALSPTYKVSAISLKYSRMETNPYILVIGIIALWYPSLRLLDNNRKLAVDTKLVLERGIDAHQKNIERYYIQMHLVGFEHSDLVGLHPSYYQNNRSNPNPIWPEAIIIVDKLKNLMNQIRNTYDLCKRNNLIN